MRWFKREQKDDPAPHIKEKDETAIIDDAPQSTNLKNDPELGVKNAELSKTQNSIDALCKKITSVKKEYDEAVGNLFDVKNELASKRRESTAANITHETLQRRVNALDTQLKESEAHRTEIRTSVKEREDASRELVKINAELDEKQKKLESVRKQIIVADSELDSIQNKTKIEHDKLEEQGRLLQKTHIMIKDKNTSKSVPKGDVIRTASLMIASLNEKIDKSHKEIEILRGVLDKERRENAKTKSRLAELERKNTAN